jgi:hypothetical protein
MTVLLEITDNKVQFLMELLNSFSFVKIKPVNNEKTMLFEDIIEAAHEVSLHKQGKIKLKTARELLNEL